MNYLPLAGDYWLVRFGRIKFVQKIMKYTEEGVWLQPLKTNISVAPEATLYDLDRVEFIREIS